jgi:hypothetical protein
LLADLFCAHLGTEKSRHYRCLHNLITQEFFCYLSWTRRESKTRVQYGFLL